MPLQKISFEYDIPEGYRFKRYGSPLVGEYYINTYNKVDEALIELQYDWIIVEKIPEHEQHKQANQNRRKHADLIHAWAEGAEIQYKRSIDVKWQNAENHGFFDENEYRIKPKTKTVGFRNYIDRFGDVHGYIKYRSCYSIIELELTKDFKQWLGDWQEVEI